MIDDNVIIIAKIAVILSSIIWLSYISFKIIKGRRDSVFVSLYIFWIFFVLPLVWDLVIGIPSYYFVGFAKSSTDVYTNVLYCLYTIYIPFILLLVAQSYKRSSALKNIESVFNMNSIRVKTFLRITVAAPLLFLLTSEDISSYLIYGAVAMGMIQNMDHHALMAASMSIAIVSCSALVLYSNNIFKSIIYIIPLLLTYNWIIGKRYSIALTVLLMLLVLWRRRLISSRSIAIAAPAAAVLIIIFSVMYQSNIRNQSLDTVGFDRIYTVLRIDYGRDDIVKMEIYAELNKDEIQILEYRGQSLLFYPLFWIPRSYWDNKPMPYAQYATSAMIGTQPRFWGWGMTTSIFGELIANMSWLGMFLSPIVVGIMCKYGDRSVNFFSQMLTPVVVSLIMLVQLTAFMPIFIIWICAIMYKGK